MSSVSSQAQKNKAVPVIFDSDMGPDYDDVEAITLLHAFADSGYVKILATVASTKYEGVAAVFNVFNTYFNRPGLLIGVPKKNEEVPAATEVYRKVLATQPDKSVTIVTTGFLTNLYALMTSMPDKYSKL